MKKVEKAQYAQHCGLKTKDLSNYIKRGKVVVGDDGNIDLSVELNADFLKVRKERLAEKSNESVEKPGVVLVKPKKNAKNNNQTPGNKADQIGSEAEQQPGGQFESLERRLKRQELLKKEAETRLLNLKEEKLKGEHIPTELVRAIILQQSQSFITAFKNSIEDFITLSAKKSNMNVNEIAEARGKVTKMINESANKAIAIAKKGVKNIVDEYAVKKEVGEHD